MYRTKRATVALLIPLLLLVGCGQEPGPPKGKVARALEGTLVPEFRMTDLNGTVLTRDGLEGKVVLIDFWATWCGPCRSVSPILQSLHERYASKGLVIIGANTSERDGAGRPLATRERAASYATEHGFTYKFTYGNDAFMRACKVEGLPTMLVIDRRSKVRHVFVGFNEALSEKLDKAIRPLLEE